MPIAPRSMDSTRCAIHPAMRGWIALAAVLAGACASSPTAAPSVDAKATPAADARPAVPPTVPEIHPGVLAGYLGRNLPDSLKLLPPPPAEGSAAFRNDQAVSRASQKLRDTPRYTLAASDADLAFPHVASVFSCALGVPVTQQQSPYLYQLLRRTLTDAALATYGAKNQYKRIRPFVHYKEGTCRPEDEAALRKDGSYPSGHTSIGWAWALILTELAPERADALLARGRSFGESRLVCNAHWQSDILEGRTTASSTVAALHANADFRADMASAATEIAQLRASGARPDVDCDAEATALAQRIDGVL
ncbi:phosphatase PAP2 family protein [Lysobacter sp. MMG2]|uniref:acid phosphatase n=1 Tax=Lysobacter sp. MMG2 TaxID=2801338 RepID=UPI0020B2E8AD|nr:phosphatase PAP2 family protein [Lysobacter sp. MMG2]